MRTLRKSLFLVPLVLALLALPGTSLAAIQLVLHAVGSVQGNIPGASTLPGHENWIELDSFQHGVSVPIGPNGQPSGPAQTSEVTISKSWDRSVVRLFQAQATAEVFTDVTFELVDTAPAKMPMTLIRWQLINANLASASESSGGFLPSLSLGFSYSQIIITDVAQGTTVTYSWNPVQSAAPETLAKGILLTPSPNPTQGQTEFRFSLPSDSNAKLALFDLRGHLVREVYSGWTSSEPTVAVWDGKDDTGKRVAQGMYVARLTYPGREVTQRITVLR